MTYEKLGASIGRLVANKQREYGDSFGSAGRVLAILYPDGVQPDQYDDMLAIVRIIDKLFRVAHGNQGDEDAYSDIVGYGLLGARRNRKGRSKWS